MLSTAYATGLGRLTVLSSLGQPLRAEIELTSPNKEEVSALVPKLASPEAFKQANIDFNSALLSLRFAVEQRGERYIIRVSSTQPINEPFVDLLLEMNSSSGRLFREYTFLLDPAELRNSQSAQVANPVSVAAAPEVTTTPLPANAGSSSATSATAPASVKRPANKSVVAPAGESANAVGKVYEVKRGDTLSKVANAYRAEGVSLDQMLVSLYKANPQAFDRNNMNRLKAGRILTIPDSGSSQAVSNGEARAVVLAHAADFNAYRNKLAGQVENAPAAKSSQAKQSASGSITAKVNEASNATKEAVDRLKLSKAANDTAATSAKSGTGKNQAEEDKIAKDKAVAEANARVKELEKNVNELQKILELKNKDLANKQAAAEAKPAAETKPATPAKPDAAVEQAASTPAVASTPVQPPVKRKVIAPPPPPPEPGFFDGIIDIVSNSAYVLWGAVVVALIAVFGIFNSRRKKKLQQFDDSILTGSSMKANSMFGSTGGQSVDTNNSVFNSNFAPSASQLDANEVDPVAEADVYIAYGRDSQAEEILKEALRTQPERHAVRVKLLEIYHSRKDPRSFERLASELYGMTNGVGDEWSQAASMGLALEPNNPLYAGGKPLETANSSSGLGVSTQPLEDLDSDGLLDSALSEDMLDSISIIDTAAGMADDSAAPADMEAKVTLPVEQAETNKADTFDLDSLDFDLGMMEPETSATVDPVTVPTMEETAVPMVPAEEPGIGLVDESAVADHHEDALDFNSIDFDLGEESAHLESADASNVSDTNNKEMPDVMSGHDDMTEPVQEAELPAMDFALEQVETKVQQPMVAEEAAMDLSLPAVPMMEAPVMPEDMALPDDSQMDSEMKLDQEEPAHADSMQSEHAASNFDFDLSGIDLNLDSATTETSAPEVATIEETPAFNAEMATKLDLAVAYHEIGDKEGARELLDEVIKGGTADQVERARNMLAQLA